MIQKLLHRQLWIGFGILIAIIFAFTYFWNIHIFLLSIGSEKTISSKYGLTTVRLTTNSSGEFELKHPTKSGIVGMQELSCMPGSSVKFDVFRYYTLACIGRMVITTAIYSPTIDEPHFKAPKLVPTSQ